MHYNMSEVYDPTAPSLMYRPSFPMLVEEKHRLAEPRSFDPDELTRRLYMVIAEQDLMADRRRRLRPADQVPQRSMSAKFHTKSLSTSRKHRKDKTSMSDLKSASKDSYDTDKSKARRSTSKKIKEKDVDQPDAFTDDGHYVPQVAAAQFTRTTLGESPERNLVHKLSRVAMKFHMQSQHSKTDAHSTAAEKTKALKRAQSTRERNYDRNQFQNPATLNTCEEADVPGPLVERSMFQGHAVVEEDKPHFLSPRRKSTGSILSKPEQPRPVSGIFSPDFSLLEKHSTLGQFDGSADAHRVDWTQSDEIANGIKSAPLRKIESRWTLRGRLGSLSKQSKDERAVPTAPPMPMEKITLSMSPKSGFFSRFKR